MSTSSTTPTLSTEAAEPRGLLLAGASAGPLYVGIGAIEALARDGFDITRHSLSLLANGDGGWVHAAMMVTTGLLTVAGAAGLAQSFGARPSRWAPRLVAVFGLGVAASGVMTADPAFGFPVGTPDGVPQTVTWHGIGHLVAGSIGFVGLIAACIVMWRWFRSRGDGGWATFSLVTGIVYLVTFVGIATGGGSAVTNLAFTVAVILGWAWLTLLFRRSAKAGVLR